MLVDPLFGAQLKFWTFWINLDLPDPLESSYLTFGNFED